MKKVIGLDLGGTFIKIGVVDENGEILEKAELPYSRLVLNRLLRYSAHQVLNLPESKIAKAGIQQMDQTYFVQRQALVLIFIAIYPKFSNRLHQFAIRFKINRFNNKGISSQIVRFFYVGIYR